MNKGSLLLLLTEWFMRWKIHKTGQDLTSHLCSKYVSVDKKTGKIRNVHTHKT